jgi:hypothetical protein
LAILRDIRETTVNAVKGHGARGQAWLKEINAHTLSSAVKRSSPPGVARFVALFNYAMSWAARSCRAVRRVCNPRTLSEVGAADVGMFFTI